MSREPNLSNPGGETTNPGSRNYDYTLKYRQDKPGTEGKENARVWSVYLDEAENHDADVIEGYRNIIDGLLIFAALFSGVVTTFVAQTSTALQSDNGKVTAALLYENNQLLRAAGNVTKLNAVPFATLAPGSITHSSTDVWVNGLFFASLALALSTALLTVLAKQWIQAYTSTVSGDGKTRALIRQFRFQGILKWQLGGIIEALPLILHGSMAIFLIGLALYVSQLSTPICGVVASITIITFTFYFGTSLLPAIYTECPYRVPFIFPLAQLVVFSCRLTRYNFLWLVKELKLGPVPYMDWPTTPKDSNLKTTEYKAVFPYPDPSDAPNGAAFDWGTCRLACNTLYWLFEHSSNHSVKEIVAEGISGLLDEWKDRLFISIPSAAPPAELLNHDIFPPAILISLEKFLDLESIFTENSLQQNLWGRVTDILSKSCSSQAQGFRLPVGSPDTKRWRNRILESLKRAYLAADERKDHVLSKHLLDLGGCELLQPSEEFLGGTLLHKVAQQGSREGIRSILKRRGSIIGERDDEGWSALHCAAMGGNLDAAVACVEQDSTLLNLKSNSRETPLDVAIRFGRSNVVKFLSDRGAEKSPNALHQAVYAKDKELVKVLLEKGWDPAAKDEDGKTSIDIANSLPEVADELLTLLQQHMLSTSLGQT
ncbi:hypothetical protein DXG01_001585 [Tephrocybe rancida]|nr:hypothetical protein DXG01_001585 [Tephrocybe rancida]